MPDKQRVRVVWYKKKSVPVDHEYRKLLRLEGAVRHMTRHGESALRVKSVHRKMAALSIWVSANSPTDLLEEISAGPKCATPPSCGT